MITIPEPPACSARLCRASRSGSSGIAAHGARCHCGVEKELGRDEITVPGASFCVERESVRLQDLTLYLERGVVRGPVE